MCHTFPAPPKQHYSKSSGVFPQVWAQIPRTHHPQLPPLCTCVFLTLPLRNDAVAVQHCSSKWNEMTPGTFSVVKKRCQKFLRAYIQILYKKTQILDMGTAEVFGCRGPQEEKWVVVSLAGECSSSSKSHTHKSSLITVWEQSILLHGFGSGKFQKPVQPTFYVLAQ